MNQTANNLDLNTTKKRIVSYDHSEWVNKLNENKEGNKLTNKMWTVRLMQGIPVQSCTLVLPELDQNWTKITNVHRLIDWNEPRNQKDAKNVSR